MHIRTSEITARTRNKAVSAQETAHANAARLLMCTLGGALPLCLLTVGTVRAQNQPARPAQAGRQGQQQTGTETGQKPLPPNEPGKNLATQTPTPAPAPSAAQLPAQLTLSEAIEYGLRLQPTLAASIASREASEERRRATQAAYYPTIRPTFQYVYQYVFGTVRQVVTSNTGANTFVPVTQGRTSVTKQAELGLNFRLFDNGLRELNQRSARQNERAAEYAESNTRLNVIGNVADLYFNALRTRALVQVSEAQVARAQNTLEVVQAQVNAQVAARKDILQAQSDLLNAQVNLLQARNNAAVAQANLKQAIGVAGGEQIQLADVVAPEENTPITAVPQAPTAVKTDKDAPPRQQTPTGPGVTPPATQGGASGVNAGEDATLINQYAEAAYLTRPDIAQQRQNIESQQTQSSISRINSGAQIIGDLSAGNQFDAANLDRSLGRNYQIGIIASYPLFDGGLLRSNYRAARAQVRTAEANLANTRLQVAVEVEQSYRTLAQARAALPAARAAQAAAQINYEAAIESRREGVGSIVDVITAQTTLVQAQTNYVQAIYDFYSADARLTRAVGQGDRVAGIGGTAPANPSPVPVIAPPAPGGVVVPPAVPPVPAVPDAGGAGAGVTP